jgi:hypothetical protein
MSSGYREADVGRCALRQQTICTKYAGRHLPAMTFVDKFIYTVVCVVSLKTWVHNLFRVMGGVKAVVFLWAKVSKQTGLTGKCHFSIMKAI